MTHVGADTPAVVAQGLVGLREGTDAAGALLAIRGRVMSETGTAADRPRQLGTTRGKLLAAAARRFYADGVAVTGIDRSPTRQAWRR